MKLSQLSYFVEICKQNNMTKAARQLHITQPTISKAIMDLECEFGIKLFNRDYKRIGLTKEGKEFLKRAEDILQRCEELEKLMKKDSVTSKEITMGISTMSFFIFEAFVKNFKKKYPDYNIRFISYSTVDLYKYVEDNVLDIALIGSTKTNPIDLSAFNSKKINYSSEVVFYTNRSNPLSHQPFIDEDMVRNEPIIIFTENTTYHPSSALSSISRNNALSIAANCENIIFYTSQLNTAIEAISSGSASCFLLKDVIKNNEDIIGIPLKKPIVVSFDFIWKSNAPISKGMEKFMDFIKQSVKHT